MLIQNVWTESSEYFNIGYKNSWKKLFRFAFVGATGAILNLTIIYILTDYIFMWYILSAIVAIECSILWNFYWNTKITFNYKFLNGFDTSIAAFRYHLSSFVGLVVNISALIILTEILRIYYLFSEILAIMLAFSINYLISVRYVWYNSG